MYFCNGLRPEDTLKRRGKYKVISYDSHNTTNDFEFNQEDGTLHIVDGDYIIFCMKEFGFYGNVQIDCIVCGTFMLLKLLDGEVYIKGDNNVVLGVDSEGTVEAIKDEAGSAIKWYSAEEFGDMLSNSTRYNYKLPQTFNGCEFIRNNLVFTLECAVKIYKTKDGASSCANIKPLLIEGMPGYDLEKAIEEAKGTKTYFEKVQVKMNEARAKAAEENKDKDKGTVEKEEKKATKKVRKKTVVKTLSSSNRKKRDDFIGLDEDNEEQTETAEFNYDEDNERDYDASDYEDYDDDLDSDDIRDIEFDLKMKQANARAAYTDSENM